MVEAYWFAFWGQAVGEFVGAFVMTGCCGAGILLFFRGLR